MKLFALVSAVSAQWATQDGCAADGVSTGSEFNADPFTWVGADLGKPKLHGSSSMKMLINMNGLKNFGGKNLNYVGMAIWSRKKCGPDFIDKVADGTVSFDILDLYDEAQPSGWYLTADQFSLYKRDDGSATSATIQFVHNSEENATKSLGNAKKDQFHLLLHGIDQVDFGNKEMEACLIGGMIGWMPADGIDTSVDYTCLAGWTKRLWN